MPIRTSEQKIRATIDTNLDVDTILQFASDANVWVTEELASVTSVTWSNDRLEMIERYLACAFIRAKDLGVKSATVGDVDESYQVNSEVTDYLLRAAGLDPTGKIQDKFVKSAQTGTAAATPSPTLLQYRVGDGFYKTVN